MRKVYLALLLMFLPGLPIWAGTVVGVDTASPGAISGNTVDGSNALAIAWNQTVGVTGSVSVNFQTGLFDSGGTFYAYLTNAIGGSGSQITAANEVATPVTFTLPDPSIALATFGPEWIDLFNGITLDAGSYYLVIGAGANSSGAWSNTSDPTVTETPGFLVGDTSGYQFFATAGDVASYLPNSNFFPMFTFAEGGQDPNLMFDVSTPEPGTIWLLGGAISLALLRRKRSV